MPYPEVKHELPKISDHELQELEKFIFGEPDDENCELNKKLLERLNDPTRFHKIMLAVNNALTKVDPSAMDHPITTDGVAVDMARGHAGPSSIGSWQTRGPSDDACSTAFTNVNSLTNDPTKDSETESWPGSAFTGVEIRG